MVFSSSGHWKIANTLYELGKIVTLNPGVYLQSKNSDHVSARVLPRKSALSSVATSVVVVHDILWLFINS